MWGGHRYKDMIKTNTLLGETVHTLEAMNKSTIPHEHKGAHAGTGHTALVRFVTGSIANWMTIDPVADWREDNTACATQALSISDNRLNRLCLCMPQSE